jgi:Rieske Fe-S protein
LGKQRLVFWIQIEISFGFIEWNTPEMRKLSRRSVMLSAIGILGSVGFSPSFAASYQTAKLPAKRKAATKPIIALDFSGKPISAKSISMGSSVSAQYVDATKTVIPVILHRKSATSILAYSAICTHLGCTVAPQLKTFNCPCHNSVFDSSTGNVISGPAPKALKNIHATIVKDSIQLKV